MGGLRLGGCSSVLLACAALALASCDTGTVTLYEDSSGADLTLSVGEEVRVWLESSGLARWGPPAIDSTTDAVRFVDADTCRYPRGATPGAAVECLYRFAAVNVGTAQVTVPYETAGQHHFPFKLTLTVTQ